MRLLCTPLVVCVLAAPASGAKLKVLQTDAERLVDQAREARERSEYSLAQSLLEEAESEGGAEGAMLHERGLLARDTGHPEEAVGHLEKAATLDPTSDARLDMAGVLVGVGRWPQAVVVLRTAFDERGGTLPADDVVADARFHKLQGFEPFQELLKAVRQEQAGPWGRVLLRIEAIESWARHVKLQLDRASRVFDTLTELFSARWVAVLALILMGTLAGSCLQQMRVMRPPWTLLVGLGASMLLWHMGALVVSGGGNNGLATIVPAAVLVFGPLIIGVGVRTWLRYRRAHGDPFAPAVRSDTLALVDRVADLGKQLEGTPEVMDQLREAADALSVRLLGDEAPKGEDEEEST